MHVCLVYVNIILQLAALLYFLIDFPVIVVILMIVLWFLIVLKNKKYMNTKNIRMHDECRRFIVHYASLTCNSTRPQHTLQTIYNQF